MTTHVHSNGSNGSSTALARVVDAVPTVSAPEPTARGLMRPLAQPAEVLAALQQTRVMLRETLVEGVDYGTIPGTDNKVLQKPGAEKVAFSFGCRPVYDVVESEIDHEREMRFKIGWVEVADPGKAEKDRRKAAGIGRNRKVNGDWQWQEKGDGFEETTGLYRYVIRCRLVRYDGVTVGEGVGSCSSLESKYRSRPHDVENTVLKMAEKRAFVASVLTAFGLSEAFTQDLEDADGRPAERQRQQTHVERDPQEVTADPVDALKNAALEKCRKLNVGAGTKDEVRNARIAFVTKCNDGKNPKTGEDWRRVNTALDEEIANAARAAAGPAREPGSDDDIEDPPPAG
jgi:hypothetical protein